MKTVKIYRLDNLSSSLFLRLKAAQMEAAQVWNTCCELHKNARQHHTQWPGQNEMQQVTRGRFALHSQSVQAIFRAFLATIDTTRELRKTHPMMRMKYPLPIELPEEAGACNLVWKNGFELHVCVESPQAEQAPGSIRATVDLGEIHLAAVTTETGKAMIVTGRGIRSLKRQRNQRLGQIAKKQSRCQNYSRRWKNLQRAKNKVCRRVARRVRDMRHTATRQVIDFCVEQEVGSLFIGNPHGIRKQNNGRHHNQRMALWEYGKDIDYLTYKSKYAHILSSTGSERGTSSQCPRCGQKQKPKGRNWACRACGFTGHRDLVGSVNMHMLAYGSHVMFPRSFTYLRPGLARRSSRADTPQRCLSKSMGQPLLDEQVPSGTGHTVEVAQKPVTL